MSEVFDKSTLTVQSDTSGPVGDSQGWVKGLGLLSSTTIVMGSMIGAGIFIVSADIARTVDSPALLIGAWVITSIMTLIAALSYAELAAMMPKAGGQYVYLREGLGPLWGFLYGWTLFLVIQTGTVAAVGVGFAKFLGIFFPSISSTNWLLHIVHIPPIRIGPALLGDLHVGINTQNLVAVVLVMTLSLVNVFGIRTGAFVQNLFTIAKITAILGLVCLGAFLGHNPAAVIANYQHFWQNAGFHARHAIQVGATGPTVLVSSLTVLAIAQVGSLFSADAWNNITFTAGEVRHPSRNLPLSLIFGAGGVLLLYLAANFVYLLALPLHGDPAGSSTLQRGIQFAAEDRVATAVMQQIFGPIGAKLMAITVLLSTVGCANGMLLSGARVYYAMAKDGLFFRSVGALSRRYHTPVASLIVQGLWTSTLCISGSYGQLLDYIVFAVLVFYILTIGALFVLRRQRPDLPRPYRAVGYPWLPLIYVVMAAFIEVVLLLYKPQYTWPGLIIVALGIPVYAVWSRKNKTQLRDT